MVARDTVRVLVLWADNKAANYGLRVLANGNAAIVRRALAGMAVEVDFQDFGPGDSPISFGTKSILRDVFSRRGPIKTKLRKYDLIIDSGAGDSFADIYGLKRLSFIIYAHLMIRFLRIPLILGPQTIGPFESRVGRFFAKQSLNQAQIVLARDSESADFSRRLGRGADITVTDVVFALNTPPMRKSSSTDVLVNVSGLLWFSDDHVDSTKYRDSVVALVSELRSREIGVALLAHVVNSPSGNDDVDACHEAAARIKKETGSAVELLVPRDLGEAREMVAAAFLVVGARMHACLNAISVGTPAIPWAYSRKFKPLLDDLDWRMTVDLRTDPHPAQTTMSMILDTDWGQRRHDLQNILSTAHERLEQASSVIGSYYSRDREKIV